MSFWSDWRARLFGDADADETGPERADPAECDTDAPVEWSTEAVSAEPAIAADVPCAVDVSAPDAATSDGLSPVEPAVAPEHLPVSAGTVAARQERAAGLILDDERLRGDLTDDEYQPLLDWALAASDQLVERAATADDDAAQAEIRERVARVKEAVQLAAEAIAAHASGATSQRTSTLAALADLVGTSAFQAAVPGVKAKSVRAVAARLATDDTGDGQRAAGWVVAALTAPSPLPTAPATAPDERMP
jgi:hypothetical protein